MSRAEPKIQHLTVDDLAERFRMPRWSVYELVKAGTLPHFHIGRRVRFRLADIEAWEGERLNAGRPRVQGSGAK